MTGPGLSYLAPTWLIQALGNTNIPPICAPWGICGPVALFPSFFGPMRYGFFMTQTAQKKTEIRRAIFARRKLAHEAGLDAAAQAHLAAFLTHIDPSLIVAGYMPIRTEISPLPVMANVSNPVCVPVVKGDGQALEFRAWSPDCDMIEGAFGAAIPKDGAVLIPDIIITPMVGFDTNGGRLGYGGGFYDRSFEEILAQKPVQAFGFAYSAQQVEQLPLEPTDHLLDAVITENGVLPFGPHKDRPNS